MAMVSSTDGSSTITGWNRRASAASFSMYLRYSFSVVAPMQCSSPRASIGFRRFPASMLPSVLPAPTILCSSSINSIMRPLLFLTSLSTALKRSSNSPRYFAPAMSEPISSEKTLWSLRLLGTSPRTIRSARPSAMAVFPTPGSPIRTGLFLVLRESMRITLLISSSRPITGSSLWFFASATRSWPYFERASYVSSGLSLVTRVLPRTVESAVRKLWLVMPKRLKISRIAESGFSIMASIMCSTETYSSFIRFAWLSASTSTASTSAEIYIFPGSRPGPVTLGSFFTACSTVSSTLLGSMPIFCRSCGISPFSCSSRAFARCSCSICMQLFSRAMLCASSSASSDLWVKFCISIEKPPFGV